MDNSSINKKNRKFTALAWVLAILVLVVAIPLNLIFDRLNVTMDMTPNSMYSLSKTTTDYLNELDSKGITVDVYFLTEMEELEGDLEVLALYQDTIEMIMAMKRVSYEVAEKIVQQMLGMDADMIASYFPDINNTGTT